MLSVGVSGCVLCAIGSDMEGISMRLGANTSLLTGNAFMARGVGCIAGTMLCPLIMEHTRGGWVLSGVLCTIAWVLSLIETSQSPMELYGYFFLLGICAAMNDTGVSILTRQLHGKHAGPWLGANSKLKTSDASNFYS